MAKPRRESPVDKASIRVEKWYTCLGEGPSKRQYWLTWSQGGVTKREEISVGVYEVLRKLLPSKD